MLSYLVMNLPSLCALEKAWHPIKVALELCIRSDADGWQRLRIPIAFAFTTIPAPNRCYFADQKRWLELRSTSMVDVCRHLWDYADAIDLNEDEILVEVHLEDSVKLLHRDANAIHQTTERFAFMVVTLAKVVQNGPASFSWLH